MNTLFERAADIQQDDFFLRGDVDNVDLGTIDDWMYVKKIYDTYPTVIKHVYMIKPGVELYTGCRDNNDKSHLEHLSLNIYKRGNNLSLKDDIWVYMSLNLGPDDGYYDEWNLGETVEDVGTKEDVERCLEKLAWNGHIVLPDDMLADFRPRIIDAIKELYQL